MKLIKKIFLNEFFFGNIFFCFSLLLLITISGCSTELVLRNANINAKSKAHLNQKQSTYFIDYIVVPRMFKERIGKKRSYTGRFLSWVYTDQSHLEKWCENEWEIFLKRHGNIVISDFDKADYTVKCDVTKIWTEKKWQWKYNDGFSAHIIMNVKIIERLTGRKVFSKTLESDFNTERAYERNNEISDEQMFNYCLSTCFQNALEKIKFVSQ
jgi:hypothetical protein